jgi:intein-encoded DNA endonuclease-like protein
MKREIKKWTNEEELFLKYNYPIYGSYYCSESLDVDISKVRRKVSGLGLTQNKETRSRSAFARSDKLVRNVPLSLFKEAINEYSSYLMGFLWADGYLVKGRKTIRLEIVNDDFECIRNILSRCGKWSVYNRLRKGRRLQTIASTDSKHLYDYLSDLGYIDKSYLSACSVLSVIPDKLKSYWWRGYFDGDGCIYVHKRQYLNQISLAGSFNQDWEFAEDLLSELGIKYKVLRRVQNGSKDSIVRFCRKKDCINFGEYIYQGIQFGLDRKMDKFNQLS